MSDDVIDLSAERAKRNVEVIEHVTRVTYDEMVFGTSDADEQDPPLVMLGCYGGALVMTEDDARRVGLELIELATVIKIERLK
jgi:hypothetical protein